MTSLLGVVGFAFPVVVAQANKAAVVFLVALCLLSAVAVAMRRSQVAWPRPRTVIVLAGFLVWAGLSAWWSVDARASLERAAEISLLMGSGLLFAVLAQALDHRDGEALGAGVAWGVPVAAGAVLVKLALGLPVAKANLAALALLAWPAAVHFHQRGRMWLAIGVPVVAAAVAAFGDNRSVVLALVLGGGVFMAALRRPGRTLSVLAAVVVMAAAVAPVAMRLAPDWATFTRNVPYLPNSAYHRYFIWKYTAGKITEKPLAGWGLDAARVLPEAKVVKEEVITLPWRVQAMSFSSEPIPLHPHNGFLQVWMELGAVGVALFLAAALIPLRVLRRLDLPPPARAAGAASFAAAMAVGAASFGVWQAWWLAAQFLAIGCYLPLLARKRPMLPAPAGASSPP